jgi:hypothetical protein
MNGKIKKHVVNGKLSYDVHCQESGAYIIVSADCVTLNGPVLITNAVQARSLGSILLSCGEAAQQLAAGGEQTVLDLFY